MWEFRKKRANSKDSVLKSPPEWICSGWHLRCSTNLIGYNKHMRSLIWPYIAVILLLFVLGLWQFMKPRSDSPTEDSLRPVSLFYYNQVKDREIGGGNPACSPEAVLPVDRKIAKSPTPIEGTIKELIKGELTQDERVQGFDTEFPHEGFELVSASLKDGSLTLEFTEIPGFTTGGSCRVTLLANQIIKTAKQFSEVSEVYFSPSELFQP